jgi:hypothetical protein
LMNSSIQSISTSDLLESEGFQTNAGFLGLCSLWAGACCLGNFPILSALLPAV